MDEIELTPSQKEAIAHSTGYLRIIACPGSGKTEVIARRIANLIKNGEKPSGIAAITFTEKAAEELKSRVRKILDREYPERSDFGDMFVGTIHAYSLELLRELDPYYRTFDVLDDPRRVAYVSKGMNYYNSIKLVRLERAHGLTYYRTIDMFLRSVDIMLTEGIDPESLSDHRFRECYSSYLSQLQQDRYFDFPTMIATIVRKLEESKNNLHLIANMAQHVVVDEFQDVDKLQGRLLDLLSEVAVSVCVVGDDDQGIYHWRGTDVSIISKFGKKRMPGAGFTDVTLGRNFRSTAEIVKLTDKFIRHNDERLPKKMSHNPKLRRVYELGDIQAVPFKTEEKELDFIVSKIKELLRADFIDRSNTPFSLSYSDFAVLTRTNKLAASVIDRFDAEGIPSIASSGQSIFERPEVQFALDCIAYVFGNERYSDGGRYHPDLDYVCDKHKRVFDQDLYPLADYQEFRRRISDIRTGAKKIIAKGDNDWLPSLGLQEFYHDILSCMGADKYEFGDVYSYNLSAVSRAISDYESVWKRLKASEVKYFFSFIGAYGSSVYTDSSHEDSAIIDAVRVLTIHKAKGLEFPVVFIPDFVKRPHRRGTGAFIDDSLYPSGRYDGRDDDERRVYYTAMTRSEKYIFLTWSEMATGGKRKRYPHPFLAEIPNENVSGPMELNRKTSGLSSRLETKGEYETSYSELVSYDRCPNDFLLRNVYSFNAGVPAAFGYGTNIHNILDKIHKDFIRNGNIPSKEEIGYITNRLFHLRYATDDMTNNMRKSAEKLVARYVTLNGSDFGRILETEKRFEFVIGNALITGQIDLLKKTDAAGNIREVDIIDFKTEKADGAYSMDYQKQLRYYAIACLESLNLKPERAFVHNLDRNDPPKEIDISSPRLEETEGQIKETVKRILARDFRANPSTKRCGECDYNKICSFKTA